MGDRLREAETHFPLILACLLQREVHSGIPGPCGQCGKGKAYFRCQECSQSRAMCLRCIHTAHIHLPFHWVQEWKGEYFVRKDLSEDGFVHHLGHEGAPCPHLPSSPNPLTLTVTHVNGIHQTRIHVCHCPGQKDISEQLILADLFPATWTKPQSVFTFEVLEDFHEDTLTSKKAAYDYVRKLRRRTNNSCAHQVQVHLSLACRNMVFTRIRTATGSSCLLPDFGDFSRCSRGRADAMALHIQIETRNC